MTKDQMRHALNVIYDQIFNQGQADLLPGLVSGPYIQHNPLFPNGLAASLTSSMSITVGSVG
jgi:predicted SnoaL-like aldol condensation-catalyzing enzyme